jgi:DNA processing protein
MASEEWLARLALAVVEGVGKRRFDHLLRAFGSASDVFRANVTALLAAGLPHATSERIVRGRVLSTVRRRWDVLAQAGVEACFCDESAYPRRLAALRDAPAVLFSAGSLREWPDRCVAIVGSRAPSVAGARAAERAATALVEAGWCVVSGLARGIDAAAHRAALASGVECPPPARQGTTIAVLGSALLSVYPPEHGPLAEQIRSNGRIVSERLWGDVRPRWLVLRNRIISGLSRGVLLIEAGVEDGALYTARFAARQHRSVAVWDWSGTSVRSDGTRRLLSGGVRSVRDDNVVAWIEEAAEGPYAPIMTLFTREEIVGWEAH